MGINSQKLAKQKYKAQTSAFLKKGIAIAIVSGMLYGFYSAFLTQGMAVGIWAEWYGYVPTTIVMSAFVCTYVLGAVGCAVNDTCAAVAMLIISAVKGTLGDVFRCIKTKPGALMIAAALAGGPIANTAYVIALTMAGPIAAAISALCAPCGAIIGRVFLKQELNLRMVCGIIICFAAGCVLSGTTFDVANMTAFIGMMIALIAAIGWGFEGAIGGYGVCMMDYQIGITIREITSALSNIIIMVPVLSLIGLAFDGNGVAEGFTLLGHAFADFESLVWIAAAGTCCGLSFAMWYKGNSMCGAALGMTCNAMYSFWTPLICWILMGVILGQDGWMLTPIQWLMAIVIVFGIFLIAMDPRELFKKEEGEKYNIRPFNYAILKYLTENEKASAEDIYNALKGEYIAHKMCKVPAIYEALMTAEKNGLCEVVGYEQDEVGNLVTYFGSPGEYSDIINKYVK